MSGFLSGEYYGMPSTTKARSIYVSVSYEFDPVYSYINDYESLDIPLTDRMNGSMPRGETGIRLSEDGPPTHSFITNNVSTDSLPSHALSDLPDLSHQDEPSSASPTGDDSDGTGAGFGSMPITRFSTGSSSFPNFNSNLNSKAKANPSRDEKAGNKGRRSTKSVGTSQMKNDGAGDVSVSEDEYEDNSNEEGGKFSIGDDEEGWNR
ncbi:hypothetical protein AYX13_05389 [Cryptococcus neoformans]|nr:hypothetical protein AYX13_05389 [Cryptococcus neoformans var. grubii]